MIIKKCQCSFQVGKLEDAVGFGRTVFEKFYRLTEVQDLVKVRGGYS